ncbi:MAG: AbrB/MazE/SpoVT family DNA-binding domain-containing protein [Gammaproteobacteria bacterium]|nr:AbrB/MazE/SpoVT family DNA-binding domain-containing protein [Gammaproteobacteria bacterium]NNJ83511.1 AbrB/MazE/SpoVT family DNA-binding domain-containing protein [Gammaproteobacteria bacterium]
MITATVTTKGQITIPKSVRDALHLRVGDRIAFVLHGEKEVLLKPATKSVDEVFGMLGKPETVTQTADDMNNAIKSRMRNHRL